MIIEEAQKKAQEMIANNPVISNSYEMNNKFMIDN
jgi:hypothetical protein